MPPLSYIIYNTFYKPVLKLYLKTNSSATVDGFKLKILKDVFHPKLFFSTGYFYEFIKKQELQGKTFLEIGCGSGLLSLLAARKGAKVTAVDISPLAIENTQINFRKNFGNQFSASIIQSDLFENLPKQVFDVIVINPPYFFKAVTVESQYAWYCGANGEYFESLFKGLSLYVNKKTDVFMILADNCDIDRIRAIALKYSMTFILLEDRLVKWERNFIFQINNSLSL